LRVAALALGCAALTTFFLLRGFPYQRAGAALSAAVARATPLSLHILEVGPHLSLLGPGIEATGVQVVAPDGAALRVERLRLRPAWSLSWLRLRPALRVAAEFAGGRLQGTLGLGSGVWLAGELGSVDLAQLPVAALWPGAALAGQLEGRLDLRQAAGGAEGTVALEVRQGSATVPRLPLPLPFESLSAQLSLGGEALLTVESLRLAGPGLEAQATGSLGRAERLGQAPCDLRIELSAGPDLRASLQGLGVSLRPDGRGRLRVTGTLAQPVVE
jgi:type II secretion system protein N